MEWIKEFKSIIAIMETVILAICLFCFNFPGVKELQYFIDLALDTFDATDMTVTMLTVLRIVGSAVGQFLFNLPNPCRLNELVTAFWPEGSFDHRLLVYS